MQALPHNYSVSFKTQPESEVFLKADNLPDLKVAPPANFGGPGDHWSPEDMLVAAVSSCFLFSFKAVAGIARLEWTGFDCQCTGTLDKMEDNPRKMAFTNFDIQVKLTINSEEDRAKAEKLLHKAGDSCLVSNSLNSEKSLSIVIDVASS